MNNLSRIAVLVACAIIATASNRVIAQITQRGLTLHHDYFRGNLSDLTGNGRDATLGSATRLLLPFNDLPGSNDLGFVELPGGSGSGNHGSHVLFDGSTLSGTLDSDGDASIEIWFDFDPSNSYNDGEFDSTVFSLFDYRTSGGSYGNVSFDQRWSDNGPNGRLGVAKDSNDIINGTWGGGNVSRVNVEGLHQYVFTFNGGNNANGTWTGYMDGSPIIGQEFGGGLSSNVYRSSQANVFSASGGGNFAIGGKHPSSNTASPKGKLYRTLLYNTALTPSEIQNNYINGFETDSGPGPKEVTFVTSGHNAPDTVYLSNNIQELARRGFDGVATWIAPPAVTRVTSGRLRRSEFGYDGGDLGQTVVWRRYISPNMYEPAIQDLQAAPASTNLDSNFLHMLTTNNTEVMDWYDDAWWDQITHNVGTLAKVANEGGLKGLLIDPERYGFNMWNFPDLQNPDAEWGGLPQVYGNRTWNQVRSKVRQRGREFGGAINDEYPDSTIMFFHSMSYAALQVNHDSLNRWPSLEMAPFGLMGPFLDGILEGTSAGTTIVDANSWSHQPTSTSDFELGRQLVSVDGLALSEVPELYADKVKVGFTLRTSYDPSEGGPGDMFDPDDPDSNFFSPAELESSLIEAIEHGDGYVLFWEGHANWWLDSATATPADGAPFQPWSKYVDPVYWDSLANARSLSGDSLSSAHSIPEPSTFVLATLALFGLGLYRLRNRSANR